jgi:hypothetical protein
MTDLRLFSTGKVECNPHDATRPTAQIGIRVSDKTEVVLGLHWSDGKPRAQWAVTTFERATGGDGWGYSALMRDLFRGPTDGEEWKNAKGELAVPQPATDFPSSTAVIARLLPLALAWEASPLRSADRLARAIALTLAGQEEAA